MSFQSQAKCAKRILLRGNDDGNQFNIVTCEHYIFLQQSENQGLHHGDIVTPSTLQLNNFSIFYSYSHSLLVS
jgi:hypothetical protein